jgi:hypothetical protein
MSKVPPSRPARPPVTPTLLKNLRRTAQHLPMALIEREIVSFLLFEGYDLRWSMYTGTNFADEVSCLIGRHTDNVKEELRTLDKKGWIKRGVDDDGRRYAELTTVFAAACELAWQRYVVRRILGAERWEKCNGDDEVADVLHERASGRGRGSYKDRVKSVAASFIDGIGKGRSSGGESPPDRGLITPSQGVNRPLRLIVGERKYGA